MSFSSPIYLFMLVPWAVIVVWVLVSRADFVRVSTTQFWEANPKNTQTRRGIRVPPLGIIFLLLAMLAAILAAAGLSFSSRQNKIRIIVDRSLSCLLSARVSADQIQNQLAQHLPKNVLLELAEYPPSELQNIAGDELAGALRRMKPVSYPATGLQSHVEKILRQDTTPVVLISDQAVPADNPLLWVMRPPYQLQNAGIELFRITTDPRPQAMVRVWNNTIQTAARLRIGDLIQNIELPRDGSRDYFVDLPNLSEIVTCELVISDDVEADNRAYLIQQGAWPRLQTYPGVPAAVSRMVEIYAQHRPVSARSSEVFIRMKQNFSSENTGNPSRSILLDPGTGSDAGEIRVEDHPLTRDTDWRGIENLIRQTFHARENASPAGLKPVAWVGQWPILSVGDNEVWIGFDINRLAGQPAFVVLMGKVLDHFAGSSGQMFVGESARALSQDWVKIMPPDRSEVEFSSGIYQRDQQRLAINVPVVQSSDKIGVFPENWSLQPAMIRYVRVDKWVMVAGIGLFVAGIFCLTRMMQQVR